MADEESSVKEAAAKIASLPPRPETQPRQEKVNPLVITQGDSGVSFSDFLGAAITIHMGNVGAEFPLDRAALMAVRDFADRILNTSPIEMEQI